MKPRGRLIAVDGANGRKVDKAARALAPRKGTKGRISHWDASGVFEQLFMEPADEAGGVALSPRLLMLLYAADLAFRLRWEIDPMLSAGHSVVAAPYVDTAMAFGRACGLEPKWLNNLFRFAKKPHDRHVVAGKPGSSRTPAGFIEFGCEHVSAPDGKAVVKRLTFRGSARSRRRTTS